MANSWSAVRPLLPSRVHRLRPATADRRIGRRTGSLLRRRSHADFNRGRVLRLGCSQSHVVCGGARDHPGGCGTRRLGRGGNRVQCRPPIPFPLAYRGGRCPRVLHRRLGKSHAYIGPERLRMGRLRADFVPAGDACLASAFGLWRARLISNAQFAAGVAAVVLGLLGGTKWLTGGFWAPDGVYSRFVWPGIGVVWGMVVSGVLLTRSPATRSGW